MEFWRFANEQAASGLATLAPSYDYSLGWLAGLLAIFSGFALFPTLARIGSSRTAVSRWAWIAGGAITMSIGFWGAQNMALLGLHLPTSYHYDALVGFLALIPVIAGCTMAIHALADGKPTPGRLHAGAASLAAGLAGMHYILMEAIQGDLVLTYDPSLAAQSLALGYAFALVALYANGLLVRRRRNHWLGALAGSVALGIMVIANHFSAMGGTQFFDDPSVVSRGMSTAPPSTMLLIGAVVLFLVTAYWLGAVIDGRLAEAGAAVRNSEARNRAVVETMMDAHIVTDRSGVVQSFNPAAEDAFGWTAAEMIGQPVSRLVNDHQGAREPSWERRSDQMAAIAPTRRRWVYAQGGRRRDGSLFPIELAVSPFSVNGEQFFSCTVRDLSDRWESESRLRRLAAAIDHAGDAITILDAEQRIQYVNPQYERQTGFTRDEVIGKQPGRAASEGSVYDELWQEVSRGRVWIGQVRSKRRDGRVIDEELTVTPVFDNGGAISGYVAVMRDITRRLETELDRRRLAEALQYCTDSIEILDAQGRIVYVNAAYEKANGQRLQDVRGSRPEALVDFGPAGASYDDMIRTAYRGAQPWSGTLRHMDGEGRLREEDVTVSPMRDERSQIHGFVVVKRDTTLRRRLEAQSQQRQKLESMGHLADAIAQELARPVEMLQQNLDRLGRSCRQLDGLLGDLVALSQASTPVSPSVLAGCLQSADAGFLRTELERHVAQAGDGLQRVAGIVGAMREVSLGSPEKADVDINRTIQSTITVSSGEWRSAAEVRTALDATLPPVRCVAGDISLVVMNLLVNCAQAVAAANTSGIRGKGVITVTTQRSGAGWLEIRISHTGKGVDAQARQQMFNPAPGAGNSAHGMAMAHDVIVRRHNGTIALESDGKSGATFIVRLPLDSAASGKTAAA